jgi:hypothetical protein
MAEPCIVIFCEPASQRASEAAHEPNLTISYTMNAHASRHWNQMAECHVFPWWLYLEGGYVMEHVSLDISSSTDSLGARLRSTINREVILFAYCM